VIITKQLEL